MLRLPRNGKARAVVQISMRAAGIVVVLLVASCASARPQMAVVTPTSVPVTQTSGGLPSPTASPSGGPTLAVSLTALGRSLACRLPVIYDDPTGQIVKGGFITFPGGTLNGDPSASPSPFFYDRAYSKWLPVWRTSVSPDGKQYAYGEGDLNRPAGGKVHVVDVATGVDKVIYSYSGNIVYGVTDFAVEGIYVSGAVQEGRTHGLWILDPAGGVLRLINGTIEAPALGGGAAWGLDFNAADPSPAPGGLEGPMNRLLRIDLRTGAATPWFYRPGADIYVLGFDSAGDPLVAVDGQTSAEVWLVNSTTAATKLYTASSEAASPRSVAAIDRHGVWLTSGGPRAGVWLYSAGSIQLVATVDAWNFSVAGGCIP